MLTLALLLAINAEPMTDSYVSLVLKASLASQQKQARPPCPCVEGGPCECVECKCNPSYEHLRAKALATGKPLMVFVGCQPVAGDWLAYRCSTFAGVSRGVVVSRPEDGRLLWLATLPAGTTADAIRAACRPAVSAAPIAPPAPAFRSAPAFIRSGWRGC